MMLILLITEQSSLLFINMTAKCSIILFLLCLFPIAVWAQDDLIPNGDFEYYSECPEYQNEFFNLNFALPWFNPSYNTPDYFNICDSLIPSYTGSGVPDNWQGSQYPRSGYGYVGIGIHGSSINGREYLSVPLSKQLTEGTKYIFTYYTVLSKLSDASSGSIGIYFSGDAIDGDTTSHVLNLTPQIQHPEDSFLRDTLNWMKVSAIYTAQGSERYVTIGNFNDDVHTPLDTFYYVPNEWYNVYYYFDDVSLYEVDTSDTDTINQVDTLPKPLIVPNLLSASANPYWQIVNLQQDSRVTLYNTLGQLLYQALDYKNDFPMNVLAAGIYLYVIVPPNGNEQKGKLIVVR